MQRIPVVIPAGQATSGAVDIPERRVLCGISIPASMTGATVSYEISFDGGSTYLPVYGVDSATLHSTSIGSTARFIAVNSAVFLASHTGFKSKIRVVAASNQTPETTINLHFREVR